MAGHILAYKNSLINHYVYGSGAKILYCLHGYGEVGSSFEFLEKDLGRNYTLYAIDFPFHGATKWNEPKPFTADDLLAILYSMCERQNNCPCSARSS